MWDKLNVKGYCACGNDRKKRIIKQFYYKYVVIVGFSVHTETF